MVFFFRPFILDLEGRTPLRPARSAIIEPGCGNVSMPQPLLYLGNICLVRQGLPVGLEWSSRKAREHPVIDTPPLGYFRVFDLRGSLGHRNATVQPAGLYDVDRCW